MIEVLRRSLLAVLALMVLWLGAAQPTLAQENSRYAAIVVDAETGEVVGASSAPHPEGTAVDLAVRPGATHLFDSTTGRRIAG